MAELATTRIEIKREQQFNAIINSKSAEPLAD